MDKPQHDPITKFTVVGFHSGKEMVIDIGAVQTLVSAYLTLVPNDKRTVRGALFVARFHDAMAAMAAAEENAALDKIEDGAKKREAKQLDEEGYEQRLKY